VYKREKNGERLTCWSHGIKVGLNTTVSNGGKYPIQPRNRPIPSTKQQTGMVLSLKTGLDPSHPTMSPNEIHA
jgi:hypothetical protein